jgi:uncharacterized protein YndB with AHSA1/START domain
MGDRVSRERWLAAAADEVWAVVTSDGWLAESVSLELWPGGEARFCEGDRARRGWVEEALAPQSNGGEGRLAFWWAADGEPASRVEITLEEEDGEGTRVRIVEARPLEMLDLVGLPLARRDGRTYGPALVA